ncbi:MAG: hypothetical protein LUC44_04175, partial [Prevotellaceae bacterium]|nr:hypothetical protein [Prevotellaceae bacterium]
MLLAAVVRLVVSLGAATLFIYNRIMPLLALFWGFALFHVVEWVRGLMRHLSWWRLVTNTIFLLYSLVGIIDLLFFQFGWQTNLCLAIAGVAAVLL